MEYFGKNITFWDNLKVRSHFRFMKRIYRNIIYSNEFIKNFFSYALVRSGVLRSAKLQLRDGTVMKFDRSRSKRRLLRLKYGKYSLHLLGKKYGQLKVINKEGNVLLSFGNDIKFSGEDFNQLGVVFENFVEEEYKPLECDGRTVLDIGANIGDTAVYFSKIKHASKIIAYEPYPYSYYIARKNIKLNRLRNVILLNQGVGAKAETIRVPQNFKNTEGSDLKRFNIGKKIKVVSLSDIIKKYHLKDAVLKMDCEGCEYSIILNSDKNTLRKFSQMMMECHYGYLNIEKKLKDAGFKVKHTGIHHARNEDATAPDMFVNLLLAHR